MPVRKTSSKTVAPAPSLTPRTDRAAALLDSTMSKLAEKIDAGDVSATVLREVLALARAAGVRIADDGQPMTRGGAELLASMSDVDWQSLGVDDGFDTRN